MPEKLNYLTHGTIIPQKYLAKQSQNSTLEPSKERESKIMAVELIKLSDEELEALRRQLVEEQNKRAEGKKNELIKNFKAAWNELLKNKIDVLYDDVDCCCWDDFEFIS